jgi:hypothetical protein
MSGMPVAPEPSASAQLTPPFAVFHTWTPPNVEYVAYAVSRSVGWNVRPAT